MAVAVGRGVSDGGMAVAVGRGVSDGGMAVAVGTGVSDGGMAVAVGRGVSDGGMAVAVGTGVSDGGRSVARWRGALALESISGAGDTLLALTGVCASNEETVARADSTAVRAKALAVADNSGSFPRAKPVTKIPTATSATITPLNRRLSTERQVFLDRMGCVSALYSNMRCSCFRPLVHARTSRLVQPWLHAASLVDVSFRASPGVFERGVPRYRNTRRGTVLSGIAGGSGLRAQHQ